MTNRTAMVCSSAWFFHSWDAAAPLPQPIRSGLPSIELAPRLRYLSPVRPGVPWGVATSVIRLPTKRVPGGDLAGERPGVFAEMNRQPPAQGKGKSARASGGPNTTERPLTGN